jgi:acetyltransferase-like isoleucine patch superfamily enzyme
MGALILNTISVGAHSVVGAGAVVTRNVPDHVQVVGIPAAIVREGIDGK